MNERIRELIKSRGIIPEDEHYEVAELIVRECAEYLSTTDYSDVAGDHNRALEIAAIDILEHFGVE